MVEVEYFHSFVSSVVCQYEKVKRFVSMLMWMGEFNVLNN